MKFGYEEQLFMLKQLASIAVDKIFNDRYGNIFRIEVTEIKETLQRDDFMSNFFNPQSYLYTCDCYANYHCNKKPDDPEFDVRLLDKVCDLEKALMRDPYRLNPGEFEYKAIMDLIKRNHYYATSDMIDFLGLTYDLCWREESCDRSSYYNAVSKISRELAKNIKAITTIIVANKRKIERSKTNFAEVLYRIIQSCNKKVPDQYQEEAEVRIGEYISPKRKRK